MLSHNIYLGKGQFILFFVHCLNFFYSVQCGALTPCSFHAHVQLAQVTGGPALSQPKQRGDLPAQKDPSVQASATKPGPQVVVQIHPSVQQPQPILPQQQDAQGGGQFLFPFQPHAWGPQLMMPFHPNTQSPAQPGPQPQQPQVRHTGLT